MTLQRAGHILRLLQRFKEAEPKLDQVLVVIAQIAPIPARCQRRTRQGGITALKVEALTRMSRGSVYLQTGKPKGPRKNRRRPLNCWVRCCGRNRTIWICGFSRPIGNANLGAAALEASDDEKAALHLGRAPPVYRGILRARPGEADSRAFTPSSSTLLGVPPRAGERTGPSGGTIRGGDRRRAFARGSVPP